MKIGMLGLGKLGLPIAQTIAEYDHEVKGYDIEPKESTGSVQLSTVKDIVAWADIIFAAPQTPHHAMYEGITPLPKYRQDFDYSYLKQCVLSVSVEAELQKKDVDLVVISTCLPGTFDKEIKHLLSIYVNYIYQPLFIAMGTERLDFIDPEFVLVGGDDPQPLIEFYETIHPKPILTTDIITAEGIKVSYNTLVTAKTVIANVWGEIADKLGMNFPDILKAWSLSTDRILSPRYLNAGMSDGGACHPRDNIALSHLAKKIGLSHDIFEDLMIAREDYEGYHADQAIKASIDSGLPLILLGRAFKPDTTIEAGSAALLMANLIEQKQYLFTHVEDLDELPIAVYFISTNHSRYKDYKFPKGSIVINPTKEIKL